MSATDLIAPPSTRPGVAAHMAARLRSYWTQAESYQSFLYWVGFFLVASALFHLGVLLATDGSWSGTVSWRKPILFGESFGLTAVSVAWILTFLPKKRIVGWLLCAVLGGATFGEVVWVSIQQWRGVPSHFNFATDFDAAAFGIGGGGLIAFTGGVIAIVTIWGLFSLQAPASFRLAIRAGLLLLVASQVFGFLMIRHGMPRVLDPGSGEFLPEALESAAIFGEAGVMKLPHALSLHAVQVLPALAFLLSFADWSEALRIRLVAVACLGYVGVVGIGAVQTFSGRAPLDLDIRWAVGLAASLLLILAPFAWSLGGLREGQAPAQARRGGA